MGKYFNLTTEEAAIRAGGRLLHGCDYRELMKQLGSNECLVGRFNRGVFYVMPVLPNKPEYDEFMHQYNGGYLLSYEFYAMPNSVFGICDVSAASTTSGTSASTTSGASASTTSGTTASTTSGTAASTLYGTAASTLYGTAASTLSGTAASTLSGTAASTLYGTAASTTSGTAASTMSGVVASNIGDVETRYDEIVHINALMAEKAGMVATCRNCKSNGRSGQKCPKCGGYCF